MLHSIKYKNENKLYYINDICNGIENGGKITMKHEAELIDACEQHSIDKVLFDDSRASHSCTLQNKQYNLVLAVRKVTMSLVQSSDRHLPGF